MENKSPHLQSACFFCMANTRGCWCEKCEQDFILDAYRCPVCAKRTLTTAPCGACIKQQPYFSSTEVLCNYQYPASHLIKAFKFNNRPEIAYYFAQKLAHKLMAKPCLPEMLIPVPLHTMRQRQRGYNQSLELALNLGKLLEITVNATLCKRTKKTDPQSSLPMKTRKSNVKGAFQIHSPVILQHVAIVDDVITTGSTVNEVAATLKKAGCQQIDVWAIART